MLLSAGQEVTVDGERAVVEKVSEAHGWVLCVFPDRPAGQVGGRRGWVDPAHVEVPA